MFAINWQTVTYLAVLSSAIAAIIALIWKIKSDRRQLRFTIFVKLLDFSDKLDNELTSEWLNMKRSKLRDPETLPEVSLRVRDRDNFLDYLCREVSSRGHLVLEDWIMLEREIKLLNVLNELCRYALGDSQVASILRARFLDKISCYRKYLEFVLQVVEKEKGNYPFPTPQYEHLSLFIKIKY